MSGSSASNLGYGGTSPFVRNNLVNSDNSHYSGSFGSNETPMFGKFGLPGAANNADAANSCVSGLCYKGGAKKLKHKIKNITKMYKRMKGGRRTIKRRINSMKRRIMTHYHKKVTKGKSRHHRKMMRGGMANYPPGYSQYQNNMPMTNTYALGGKLSPNESALANPPIFQKLGNCTNCVDNYNHNTNTGTASRGWW
jgi:hypothetical protein